MNTKIIWIVMISLFTLTAYGQTSFGVHAGVNFQNLNGKHLANGDKLKNKLITGYNVGANVQIPVAPEFYVQPGIMFSLKGADQQNEIVNKEVRLGYLEVPVNLVFKPMLGNGHFLLGFGPYVAYGLTAGKDRVAYDSEIDLVDPTTAHFKRFDAGANLFAGYEMANGLSMQLNTQLGLLDINPDVKVSTASDANTKNTGFGISLGYRF